ncbi:MAG: hypothetical protein PHD33_02795, partial [Atribacterota bacterium]|nr:hypothetical protein [Atribacterota bacterium]
VPSYDPVVIEASEPAWIKILHNNQILFENYIFPDEDLLIKTAGTVDFLTNKPENVVVTFRDQNIVPEFSNNQNIYQFTINTEN